MAREIWLPLVSRTRLKLFKDLQCSKKKLNKPKEDARSEINPVYGTYEVSSDPLAEVGYQLQQG